MTMRKLLFLFALAATPAVAQGVEIGPNGVEVYPFSERHASPYPHYYRHGVNCRELRWRCVHKEELGEEGMGNCRRYRDYCE